MRYALLVYNDRRQIEQLDEARREEMTEGYYAIGTLPGYVSRIRLKDIDTATTIRSEGGKPVITDGPFADTKEVFGGLFLVESDNIDGALEIASKIPAVHLGGCVEVRPVFEDLRTQ